MILYGASGHAKVIIELAELLQINITGILDDNPNIKEIFGYPVFNPDIIFLETSGEQRFFISIGNNSIRKRIVDHNNFNYQHPLLHPRAVISKSVTFGVGTVVMGNAIINADSHIGNHAIINTSASIDHDCVIGNFSHISPNATLTGGVHIEEGSQVGAGAIILPEIKVGKWVTIGAGTTVTKDVPDFAVLVGNPGRIIKYNN